MESRIQGFRDRIECALRLADEDRVALRAKLLVISTDQDLSADLRATAYRDYLTAGGE